MADESLPTFRFAAIGLDHRHIYEQVGRLVELGCECAGYWTEGDPQPLKGFAERFPDLRRVDDRRRLLEDPEVASQEFDMPMGRMSVANAIDMIVTNDVFLHAWDLARATGQDETLDPDEVHRLFQGMEPLDDMLRQSGHYGPKVEPPPGADHTTRLMAFIGRTV